MAVVPVDAVPQPHKKHSRKRHVTEGVAFATAGDKGIIRIWNTLSSDPIHTLQALPRGVSESSESSAPQSYCSLMYSHGCLLGVTFDHSVLVYDSNERFHQSKQVSCLWCCELVSTPPHTYTVDWLFRRGIGPLLCRGGPCCRGNQLRAGEGVSQRDW